jgi:arylsulfatase A-like enzyme
MIGLLLVLLAPAAAPAASPAPAAPRVVVLVTLDTTRADHLGCYGYARPTSPFLDSLAASGVLFENAFAAIAHTGPSHAALFSGLYPSQSGVRANGQSLPGPKAPATAGIATLSERFRAAGYATAAFTSVGFLLSVTRGFDDISVGAGDARAPYRQADRTVQEAINWLAQQKPEARIFVWVHIYDPHKPACAPERYLGALSFRSPAEAASFASSISTNFALPRQSFESPERLARAYAAYDAEIRFADAELRRLHQFMEARGMLRDAWWVVAGDHGEGLGQHNYQDHSRYVYAEQLHVPLIVAGRGIGAGRRVAGVAQLVDLWPTFATLLGQEARQPGHALNGISLLGALLKGELLPPREVYAERRPRDEAHAFFEPGDLFAIQDLDWKYIAKTEGEDELYDLRSDPREVQNLVRGQSPVREGLERAARTAWARFKAEAGAARTEPLDPKVQEELRALGYVN